MDPQPSENSSPADGVRNDGREITSHVAYLPHRTPDHRAWRRFVAGIAIVIVVQLAILGAAPSLTGPPSPPDIFYNASWFVSGCQENVNSTRPLNVSLDFSNFKGPDAYAVMGFYLNGDLNSVFAVLVPRGAFHLEYQTSYPVECSTFKTARFALVDVIPA